MKPVFVSQSAKRAKVVAKRFDETKLMLSDPKAIQVGIHIENNFIAWIGKDFPNKDQYGFKNLDIAQSDLSILVNAKLLVIIHTTYSRKVNAAVNFAYEYGIPTLWIDSILPPGDKVWFFNAVSNDIYWELICQLAK